MSHHILIVEDHPDIRANMEDYLDPEEFTLTIACDGETALEAVQRDSFDAILLDIMLPGIDGLEVCRHIRAELNLHTPILMLTARDTLPDKLEGYDAGTDDYLTKPFALEELEVRLRALVRRASNTPAASAKSTTISVGPLDLDAAKHLVHRDGTAISLNPTAFRILETLMRAYPDIVTRDTMEEQIWGNQPPGSDALRTHMAALRKAIDKPYPTPLIQTLYGVGFRLEIAP